MFAICNEETGAEFKQTCGIPFTLLQSTAKLATEKDCAFFFRSINPVFPLLLEEEKKALLHDKNKPDYPGTQKKTRLTTKSSSINRKSQKGEHNLIAGYLVGDTPKDAYGQIEFLLTRKKINYFIQEGKISLPLYSELAQSWILTSPQGDYVWLCPSKSATLENESLSLCNVTGIEQSTGIGTDQTIFVLGKYAEDKKLLFVTPDLDVCTVAYKKDADHSDTYYDETNLAHFASQASPPEYVITGRGTHAYFDLAQALLKKFSAYDPYSDIQMIQHGPEASNPTSDPDKLSPLENIVAVLPHQLALNPILCKTKDAFAKLTRALQDRAYLVEKHLSWHLDTASSPHAAAQYINQPHSFYNAHINQNQISGSPPRPEVPTPSRLATR